ncbi:hypothetical protein L3X38_041699 [Prunus dulcis]|uniref:Uncharacterized protein n=1 Tax=Prunus dulcis TaxID=3755 RepID=A0AAD4UV78_PRUDU|nr:hypothetical protein L3X38_041699 [Prunus dulcis]
MKNCILSLVLLEDYYASSRGAPWVDWKCWFAISSMQEAGIGLMPCSLVINDNEQTFVIKQRNVALTCDVMRLLVVVLVKNSSLNAGFLDPTGDKKLAWSSCYNRPNNLLVLKDPPHWVQIEHFWREFSSVDHYSGGKSFYLDEEEN